MRMKWVTERDARAVLPQPPAGAYDGLYLSYLQKQACLVAPAKDSLTGIKPITPDCTPPYYALNGSLANVYNSTTMNDKVAWAATWMYR